MNPVIETPSSEVEVGHFVNPAGRHAQLPI